MTDNEIVMGEWNTYEVIKGEEFQVRSTRYGWEKRIVTPPPHTDTVRLGAYLAKAEWKRLN